MKQLAMLSITLALGGLLTSTGWAGTTIFEDNFNSYPPTQNWPGSDLWTVSDGTVDLIGEGTAEDFFPPGYGLYLDMGGSSFDAGKITSIPLDLQAGDYVLSFAWAGNQRSDDIGALDEMFVSVGEGSLLNFHTSAVTGTPFFAMGVPFTVVSPTWATISFEGVGGDNAGMLLDNVSLIAQSLHVVPTIPAPGAVVLGLVGLVCTNRLRRRRIV
ncbi:MAG: hypothetical protein JSW27_10710 [Phycisphaerales bacterium]|nr:MAG: hypothetical protein JSW27_10710 [Phycisphaerales bacterium]